MPKLAKAVKAKAKIVVAKGIGHRKLLLGCHSYLEFMLRPRISDHLPVMLPVHKGAV